MGLALDAYKDAREYWYADIQFYSNSDNQISYSGSLPMGMAGVTRIIYKYKIPTKTSDIWGINQGASRATALSTIWNLARSAVDEARTALILDRHLTLNVDPDSANTVKGEAAMSVANRMLGPALSSTDGHRISSAFVNAGKFVCGMVVTNIGRRTRLLIYI